MTEHLLQLFDPKNPNAPDFGTCIRLHVKTSQFTCLATSFLYHLVNQCPSKERLVQGILQELGRCTAIYAFVSNIDNYDPITWGNLVRAALPPPRSEKGSLENVLDFAKHYFIHLAIAFYNPSGHRTPQISSHPTPNRNGENEIEELLAEATGPKRSQSALKELVQMRDGTVCPISGWKLAPVRGADIEVDDAVGEPAHVLPFSLDVKTQSHLVIEVYTGGTIDAGFVLAHVNHPDNSFEMQHDIHAAYDRLSWGLEAVETNQGVIYTFRHVRGRLPPCAIRDDGAPIDFGSGLKGDHIAKPDPRLCNLRLAVARVMHLSGAAEVLDAVYRQEEDLKLQTSELGKSLRCEAADGFGLSVGQINFQFWCR